MYFTLKEINMKTFAEFLNEALDTTSKFENELLKRGVIIKSKTKKLRGTSFETSNGSKVFFNDEIKVYDKSGEEKLFIDARSAKNIAKAVERVLEYI